MPSASSSCMTPMRMATPDVKPISTDSGMRRIRCAPPVSAVTIRMAPASRVSVASTPKPGKVLTRGAVVDLVVSKGPKPIEVTDFTGKSVDRAEQVLTEQGLEVEITEENSDTVPEGKVWVMGDHRSVSEDSRAHRQQPGNGFVPVEDVIGEADIFKIEFARMEAERSPSPRVPTLRSA